METVTKTTIKTVTKATTRTMPKTRTTARTRTMPKTRTRTRFRICPVIIGLILLFALSPAKAQKAFPYPTLPDTLHSVEQRAAYLSEHYWDNYDFADTLLLKNEEVTEQGFVNFIDILARFNEDIAKKGIHSFAAKAFSSKAFSPKASSSEASSSKASTSTAFAQKTGEACNQNPAKEKFENLIEHYFEDPESPMRNDQVYSLFLEEMKELPCFDETEKIRIDFKLKAAKKNLPGTVATNISFMLSDGKAHQLSDYKNEKVIIYFYDPECENCHKTTAWLEKQQIPADIKMLRIVADDRLSSIYSLKAMPTIYLLDKQNIVILKDCTAEQLINAVQAL